jgi:hypothetical protein
MASPKATTREGENCDTMLPPPQAASSRAEAQAASQVRRNH